jgi:hypothetical protein
VLTVSTWAAATTYAVQVRLPEAFDPVVPAGTEHAGVLLRGSGQVDDDPAEDELAFWTRTHNGGLPSAGAEVVALHE